MLKFISLNKAMPIKKAALMLLFFSLFTFSTFGQAKQEQLPGVAIAHVPASSKMYIGSPSICVLPNGNYIASHDFFGPKSGFKTNAITEVFESTNKGESWKKIAELNQFWSGLFVQDGRLYLMGVRNSESDCVIRRSDDGGHTWTEPVDDKTGLLIPAKLGMGYHTSTVPLVEAKGRLWRAMEEIKTGGPWGGFKAFMMSIKTGEDLLNAANWVISNKITIDTSLKMGTAWLEGNAVINPKGNVVNVLRVNHKADTLAAMLQVANNGKTISFDPKNGFINLPGASKKFTIRFDQKSKKYWALTNAIAPQFKGGNAERTRNTVYLLSSKNLKTWQNHGIILQGKDVAKQGFQYVDWQFEGEDIITAVRTAFDDGMGGADNQHNANYLTFFRVKDFRELKIKPEF